MITLRYSVSSTSNLHFSALRNSLFSPESLENPLDDVSVLFLILGEDQDVIQIDGHLSLSDQVPEYVIHHPLEGGGRVGEPEEHDGGLKQSSVEYRMLPFPHPLL